jgi:hypothetical protein
MTKQEIIEKYNIENPKLLLIVIYHTKDKCAKEFKKWLKKNFGVKVAFTTDLSQVGSFGLYHENSSEHGLSLHDSLFSLYEKEKEL